MHQITFDFFMFHYKLFFIRKIYVFSRNINVTLKWHNFHIIHEKVQGQCPDELRWSGVQTSNL